MKLSQLLEQSGLTADARNGDADITAVCADSRHCDSRSVFVAVRGTANDGHQFISSAVDSGAAAIVAEDPAVIPSGIPSAIVADTHEALGCLAQAVQGWPARQLSCIGVTGTNGKTTVTHLIRNMLSRAGRKPGLIGTISYDTGERSIPAKMTTPDAVAMADMMAEMVRAGASHVVMEASSHALDQKRTAGIDFDVAVFTNLSGDHLDYHGTMDRYLQAKCELFASLAPDAVAVINRDDASADAIAEATQARVLWYGLSEAADIYGRVNRIDVNGTDMQVNFGQRSLDVQSRLIGRHNVYNALAAVAAVTSLGIDPQTAVDALGDMRAIPGRLQPVPSTGGWDVFIDYAHTDDALANVLGALQPIAQGRVIVVFGCGGDRDRSKRPRMAKVAEDFADRIVVTTDNPRNEDPQAILDEVVAGFTPAGLSKADVVLDRRDAIACAIDQAQPGDVVLIAGKGHETYQVSRGQRTHFDDAEAAAECIARREAHA